MTTSSAGAAAGAASSATMVRRRVPGLRFVPSILNGIDRIARAVGRPVIGRPLIGRDFDVAGREPAARRALFLETVRRAYRPVLPDNASFPTDRLS